MTIVMQLLSDRLGKFEFFPENLQSDVIFLWAQSDVIGCQQ